MAREGKMVAAFKAALVIAAISLLMAFTAIAHDALTVSPTIAEEPLEVSEPTVEVVEEVVEAVEEPAPIIEVEPTYAEPTYSEPTHAPYQGSSFKRDGVWYDDEWRYTWYSSNDAYHYRTGEWEADEQGVYRDADGYAVVASSDLAEGTVIEGTPFGDAKVYDCGCPSGTVDVYVNF